MSVLRAIEQWWDEWEAQAQREWEAQQAPPPAAPRICARVSGRARVGARRTVNTPVVQPVDVVLVPLAAARRLQAVESPETALLLRERRRMVVAALNYLTCRQRRALIFRYGLDGKGERTRREVGALLGCSAERARQLEQVARRRLRRRAPELRAVA